MTAIAAIEGLMGYIEREQGKKSKSVQSYAVLRADARERLVYAASCLSFASIKSRFATA
jgi:hypothetical protein